MHGATCLLCCCIANDIAGRLNFSCHAGDVCACTTGDGLWPPYQPASRRRGKYTPMPQASVPSRLRRQ